MKFYKNLSIKNKLVIALLLITIITGTIGTSIIIVINNQYAKKKMVDHYLLIGKLLAENCIIPIDYNNTEELENILGKFRTLPLIEHAQVYNKDFKLLATYNKTNKVLEEQNVKIEESFTFSDGFLIITEPVEYKNKNMGVVYIKISMQQLVNENYRFIFNILIVLLVLIVISYIIALAIQKTISKPIIELSEITQKITEDGNFSVEIHKKTNDEIGTLYDNYSLMIKELATREKERDIAIEKLKESEEKFKKMNESAFDAKILINKNADVIYCNKSAQTMFGYSENDFLNSKLHKLVLEKQYHDAFLAELKHFNETGQSQYFDKSIEFEAINSADEKFPIDVSLAVINLKGEKQITATIRNISQKKKNEKELIEAKNKAEESDKLKSAFLANMSHEIRTPMNSIIGFSELLIKPGVFEKQGNKFLNFIISSGKSLLNLINDIIDVSKIEAGQLKIKKEPTPINSILAELYTTYYELYDFKNQEFDLRLNRVISDETFSIVTDPYRLKQIFNNLISNAIKFTDQGFIEFGYEIKDSNKLIFYVKDTGTGMPKEKVNIIFERFGQIEDSSNKNQSGTGLGLAISKKIVELLGGEMFVETEESKGSKFYFTLPYKEQNIRKAVVDKSTDGSDDSKILNDVNVLVAEDEEMNFFFLEEVLISFGAKVLWAKNGEEAVEYVKSDDIKVILMDIKMPKIDGYEATKIVKEIDQDIIVIAQTAYAMADEKEKSFEKGCDYYLTKPIDLKDFKNVLKKVAENLK